MPPPEIHSGTSRRVGFFPGRTGWLGILLVALVFASGASAQAASNKTLTWDASPEAGVVGYKIYYGTASYNYTMTATVGKVTSATIDGLVANVTYYFAVTAIYGFGEESDFSNEATYVVPSGVAARLQATPLADGGTQLTAAGEINHNYQIQAATDVNTWIPIATRSTDSSGAFEYVDYISAALPVSAYRLQDLGYAAPAPAAQLHISTAENKVVSLTGIGQANRAYEIQATPDLTTWTALSSTTADTGGVIAFTDFEAPNHSARYYRLRDLGYAVAAAAQLQIAKNSDGTIILIGAGRFGHTYDIQASEDLTTWVTLDFKAADGNGAFAFTDFDAPNYPSRYYRTVDTQP